MIAAARGAEETRGRSHTRRERARVTGEVESSQTGLSVGCPWGVRGLQRPDSTTEHHKCERTVEHREVPREPPAPQEAHHRRVVGAAGELRLRGGVGRGGGWAGWRGGGAAWPQGWLGSRVSVGGRGGRAGGRAARTLLLRAANHIMAAAMSRGLYWRHSSVWKLPPRGGRGTGTAASARRDQSGRE